MVLMWKIYMLTEIFQANIIVIGFGNQLDEIFVIHLAIVDGTIAKRCLRHLHVSNVWLEYLQEEYAKVCLQSLKSLERLPRGNARDFRADTGNGTSRT